MTEHTSSYYAASANKYAPFDTLNESITCDVLRGWRRAIPGSPPRCIWRKRALT
ncbi:gamma-glutamylputrescine oxidoreductase [Escherichia coli]|nr:gamma-glutamylputrescine oxidoreductase [Escherichia coli]